MNIIGERIRKIREEKGFSQDILADELQINQSSYGRLEKNDDRLTITKLQRIAKFLEVTVCKLIDEQANKIITQNNHDSEYSYNNVENLYQGSKEHIDTLKETNQHLKDEIAFLRGLIEKR